MASKPSLQAGRAIASVLVERYTFYPLITITLLLAVSTSITGVLVFQYSLWWLLLFIPVIGWLMLALLFLLISFATFTKLRPRILKKDEYKEISSFIKEFGVRYAAAKGIKKSPTALAGIIVWKFFKSQGKYSPKDEVSKQIEEIQGFKQKLQKIINFFA